MPGATGRAPKVLPAGGSVEMRREVQGTEFYLAGLLCLTLAVLKLWLAFSWPCWRVLLPIWVVLGHNAGTSRSGSSG
jgi:hypothetical protein